MSVILLVMLLLLRPPPALSGGQPGQQPPAPEVVPLSQRGWAVWHHGPILSPRVDSVKPALRRGSGAARTDEPGGGSADLHARAWHRRGSSEGCLVARL